MDWLKPLPLLDLHPDSVSSLPPKCLPPWSRRLPSRSSQNPLPFHLWDPALLALAQGRHRAGSEDTPGWTRGGRVTFWGPLWPLSDAMQAHHHPKLAIPSSWSHIIPKLAQWSPWPGRRWREGGFVESSHRAHPQPVASGIE